MIGSASPSQRSRSGKPPPNAMPEGVRAPPRTMPPPMPRIARPPEMWSRVVAIFAVSAGSRNVLAPTIRPIRIRSVAWAHAASVSQPSRIGPSELPTIGYRWSHVQSVSKPRRSARRPASRSAGHVVYWFQHRAPRRTSDTRNLLG